MKANTNPLEKMDLQSANLTQKNIEKLLQLFPNCVTEIKDKNGTLKRTINFDKLKENLGEWANDTARERYEFTWPGKREAQREAYRQINKTLRPAKDESVNWDTTQNLYIEGDNLEVLKLLQESYLGKVKMIYIDPPYNTGNDFIYKDNFARSREEEDLLCGNVDEEGTRLVNFERNSESNGRFHSDWCSMMYSRLLLAKNLLSDDGVIFISIDDNEATNLRRLCDEVFGEENFVAQVVWQKKYAATNDSKGFSTTHDYIVVYQKSISFNRNLLPRTEEQNKPYKNDDNDGKGLWRSDNLLVKSFSESGVYPIINPNTKEEFYPPKGSCWRASRDTMKQWLDENRIYFGKDGKGAPQLKRYLNEVQQGRVPVTWWTFEEVGHNDAANKEVQALFGGKAPFDTPKPTTLLAQMLRIGSDKDSIILDFFSGSATTAHAVMQLNAEDGGNRQFIMVQLPEVTDEKSEAYKAGYQNICEIGKERIRRAGTKLKEKFPESNFDAGFRVLKVDSGNREDVSRVPDALEQDLLSGFEQNLKSDRSGLDLLFGCLLDWGLELSKPFEERQIENRTVYFYDGNVLAACFEENVPASVVKAIAESKPGHAVFCDASFGSSAEKINVVEIFKHYSPDTLVKVI